MAHVHYEEEQRFANLRWIWLAIPTLMLIPLVIVIADEKSSQEEIPMILLSTLLVFLPVIAILFFSRLLVKIDHQSLSYKFIPVVLKWKIIPKDMIESFEVSPKQNFLEKWECGYRKNSLTHTIVMNITGEKFARLKLRDGRKIKIGTANPESFERALRKLTSSDND